MGHRVLPEMTMRTLLSVLFLVLGCNLAVAQVPIPAVNTAVAQDFDTLATSGTSAVVPAGWLFLEAGTGANTTYAASAGTDTGGNTYSYGTGTASERAFGSLNSGSNTPTLGASFINNTGATLTALVIRYTGEHWRLGASGRDDRLDFQYSFDATALNNGTWTDLNALDFSTPNNTGGGGARDGNAPGNRRQRIALLNGLGLAPGAVVFLRWNSFDASGSDDGLAIDDFELRAFDTTPAVISVQPLAFVEGNSGTSNALVRVALAAPVTAAVSFDASAATATADAVDFTPFAAQPQTIAASASGVDIAVSINGDIDVEPNEDLLFSIANVASSVPLIIANASAPVTLVNDDPGLRISQIQGNGNNSPLAGSAVAFEGIVTGAGARGFFIQEEDADADANPMTSEGIYVFTGSLPAAGIVSGAKARVVGTVVEFNRAPNAEKLGVTEITGAVTTVVSSGNPLPGALALAVPSGGQPIDRYEPYEGMRVTLAGDYTVVGPTDGSMVDATAQPTQFGSVFVVPSAWGRPYREPGSDPLDVLSDLPTPCARPCNDSNEEIISVDTDDLLTPALALDVGQGLSNIAGPLHYDFGSYIVVQDPVQPLTVTGSAKTPIAVPLANSRQFTIGSYNLQRLYDDVDDPSAPANEEPVVSAAGLDLRLGKFSAQVRNYLLMPDILAVIEVENLAVLQRLADRINLDAGSNDPQYGACLVDGGGFGRLDVGFLVKQRPVSAGGPARVQVALGACNSILTTATHVDPRDGSVDATYDRPPLRLDATINDPNGAAFAVSVIANHFLSLLSVNDNTTNGASTDGERARVKRRDQAEELAAYLEAQQVASPSTRFVVVGDFNAFEYNDSYGDIIGGLAGSPAPAVQQLTPVADLLTGNLVVMTNAVPWASRYSYVESGNAQTLDHVLINPAMDSDVYPTSLAYARINAEFANDRRALAGDPRRASDHDPVIGYFTVNAFNVAPVASGSIANQNLNEAQPMTPLATAGAFSDADGDALAYSATGLPAGLSINTGSGEISGAPDVGSAGASPYSAQVTATDPFNASATVTFQITVAPLPDAVFADGFE